MEYTCFNDTTLESSVELPSYYLSNDDYNYNPSKNTDINKEKVKKKLSYSVSYIIICIASVTKILMTSIVHESMVVIL